MSINHRISTVAWEIDGPVKITSLPSRVIYRNDEERAWRIIYYAVIDKKFRVFGILSIIVDCGGRRNIILLYRYTCGHTEVRPYQSVWVCIYI